MNCPVCGDDECLCNLPEETPPAEPGEDPPCPECGQRDCPDDCVMNAPYVCPSCHAVASKCEPGCREEAMRREDDALRYWDWDDPSPEREGFEDVDPDQ